MRVLYASHTGELGGGERSLLALLAALEGSVAAVVACPAGPLADALRERGVETTRVPTVSGSFALHPARTPVAVGETLRLGLAVRRAARRRRADLVHANSVRAGLAAVVARRLGGPASVVHVRDSLPPGMLSAAIRRTIGAGVDGVIANSRYTASRFGAGRLSVVYPSLDLDRFDLARIDRAEARQRLGLAPEDFALGVVAQLTPWKGQEDALRTLALVRDRLPAARLVLAGEAKFVGPAVRFDNRAYERNLRATAAELGVAGAVRFLGEREDAAQVLRALDLLLAPSWEEPFGRTVLEAMAMGLPVLATEVGGPAELIEHGVDGLLLPPRDPARWAGEVVELAAAPARRAALGGRARTRALEFGPEREAAGLLEAYAAALGPRRAGDALVGNAP